MEPKDLREAYDRQKAENAQLAQEFRTFRAEVTFKEQGLTPKHAQLYLAANPDGDVTPEAVQNFASEYGLQPAQAAPPADPAPDPGGLPEGGAPPAVERSLADGPNPEASLANLQGAAGTPAGNFAAAAPAVMSQAEFQKLLASNPQEAAKAYAEGRAPRNEANIQADQLAQKGIIR
jgi:hypothetical protein